MEGGGGSGSTSSGGRAGDGGGPGPSTPVDCAGLVAAGFELCDEALDSCGAVFHDGSGCTALCAAAGLTCEVAYENLDEGCGADETRAPLPCDSGHQSDYCLCRGYGAGTGGMNGGGGTGGSDGSGGATGAADCNGVTDQPIIEVAKDGSGDFDTVQAALNGISKSNGTPTQIRIAPGIYTEKLVVDRPFVTLCGQTGQTESTVLTYGDSANTPNGEGGTVGTSGSYSVNVSASDVSAENITFENSAGPVGQAVALLLTGNRQQFRNCRMLGHQDTLYVKGGTQYFKNCYVEGTVDFIFGGATAVFDGCTIHNVGGGSAITAPSTDEAVPFGIVFLGGEVTAAGSVKAGSVALGRNWRPYGSTTYLGTELGSHISGVGWIKMGDNTLETARFAEYETSGPGANPGARAPESRQLSDAEAAAYTVDGIFGDWSPSFSD